jgi:hypothetical protein
MSIYSGVIYGFFKGATHFTLPEELGELARSKVIATKDFLADIYVRHCLSNLQNDKAIAIVDYIGNVPLFAVLNHARSNLDLHSKVDEALGHVHDVFPLITSQLHEDVIVAQLFPDFIENEWRYLFIPTPAAFGHYIDRVYDLKNGTITFISSSAHFKDRFSPHRCDKYKFIIGIDR